MFKNLCSDNKNLFLLKNIKSTSSDPTLDPTINLLSATTSPDATLQQHFRNFSSVAISFQFRIIIHLIFIYLRRSIYISRAENMCSPFVIHEGPLIFSSRSGASHERHRKNGEEGDKKHISRVEITIFRSWIIFQSVWYSFPLRKVIMFAFVRHQQH